jgi:hypothetical protein
MIGPAIHNDDRVTRPEQLVIWSLGCALLGHVASFFSVTYFDQIIIFWYLVIAMIAILNDLNPSDMTIYVEFQTDLSPEMKTPSMKFNSCPNVG